MGLATMLVGCEGLYAPGDISSIRSQRQVDAYNSTFAAEEDKLVCTRERPWDRNILRFVCMTVAQQSRYEARTRDELQLNRQIQDTNVDL